MVGGPRAVRCLVRRTARLVVSMVPAAHGDVLHDPPGAGLPPPRRRSARPPRPSSWRSVAPTSASTTRSRRVRPRTCATSSTGTSGTSLFTGEKITDVIQGAAALDAELAGLAFLTAILVAIPLGVLPRRRWPHPGPNRSGELAFKTTPLFVLDLWPSCSGRARLDLRRVPLGAGRAGPSSYVLPVAALALAIPRPPARIVRAVRCASSTRTTCAPRPWESAVRGATSTCATRCRTR